MSQKDLPIIGNNALVTIAGIAKIPAKVDTGADSSCLWASNLTINPAGQLEFTLLGPEHPLYTGEIVTIDDFSVQQVRNSTGHVTIRYRITLPMKVHGKIIRTRFTLSDRSKNRFPVLIGRKTIQNKFLVDVSKIAVPRHTTLKTEELNAELAANPHEFHQKYMKNQS